MEEVERVGHALASDGQESMQERPEVIVPDSMPGSLTALPLPFERVSAHAELEEISHQPGYMGEWAQALLDQRSIASEAVLEIQDFRIGPALSLVAFNAEMVTHFGLLTKTLSGGSALPCGYSNGMIGYVVTDQQRNNGGYEVDESTKYFALPSRFAAGNQQLIDHALTKVLRSSL